MKQHSELLGVGMISHQAGSAWKLNTCCVMWCLSEWHCENPLNVFIIIGPKVGTQSLCRFSSPPSPCVTGLPALLKLLRNYLRDFKCPLIGNGRHAGFCCLTSINTVGKFHSGVAKWALFLLVSGRRAALGPDASPTACHGPHGQ